MLDGKQNLRESLELVVETIVRQTQSGGSRKILEKPDFWTLGYAGGCCLFVLSQAGLKESDSLFHASLISTFSKIFGAEKAPRLASYFLTFLNAPELVTDILDLDSDSYNKDNSEKKDDEYFLQRVRGIYRVEVFEKFVSLSISINEVVRDAKNQAESDMKEFISGDSPIQPDGLMQHLLSMASENP